MLKEKSSEQFKIFMADKLSAEGSHRNILIPEDLKPEKPRMAWIQKSTVRLIVGRKFW